MNSPADPDYQQYRAYLLRYALLQLRDRDLAEDVVQETLLAAIEARARYSGKSSVRTWLTGILKHKIIDVIRRKSREPALDSGDEPEADLIDALFAADGHWRHPPADWGNPEQALEDRGLREVFEICSRLIPARHARAFMMREVMELDTDEICRELGITPTNLWVMLHRARLGLRECLEIRWFGRKPV